MFVFVGTNIHKYIYLQNVYKVFLVSEANRFLMNVVLTKVWLG
jgi:hypothetical protein